MSSTPNTPNSRSFWGAVASWYDSKPRARAKGERLGVMPAAPGAGVAWQPNGERFFRKGGRTSSLIQADRKLHDILVEMVNAAAPAVVTSYDEQFGGLAIKAFREWPWASGLSRAMLSLEYTVEGDRFVGRFVSGAPYTMFIRGAPHRTLIDRPAAPMVMRLGDKVLDILARR
jgi:hypothetical protein